MLTATDVRQQQHALHRLNGGHQNRRAETIAIASGFHFEGIACVVTADAIAQASPERASRPTAVAIAAAGIVYDAALVATAVFANDCAPLQTGRSGDQGLHRSMTGRQPTT